MGSRDPGLAEAPTLPPALRISADRRLPEQLPDALSWLRTRPFFQAGLQGYSDTAMRIVARRRGSPYCVTEALLDSVLIHGGRGLDQARLDPEDHPIAGQLMGSNATDMAAGARILVELGYDVVDLNLACPVKRIRTQSRGGHLLAAPEEAIDILKTVRQAIGERVPLTVKLRRGSDDSVRAERDFHRIFETVIDEGYTAATVHGRSVEQKYQGPARWAFLSDLVRRYPEFLIFGSGDVFTAESIYEMVAATGVRAASVARGAIANPWIFERALTLLQGDVPSAPGIASQRLVLEEQLQIMRRSTTEHETCRRMRKLGIRLSQHHPDPIRARDRFIAMRSLSGWSDLIDDLYSTARPEATA